MASNPRSASAMGGHEKTYFEQQREALIGEIAMVCVRPFLLTRANELSGGWQSFEHVLASINKLNRSLEAVVAVRGLDFFFFSFIDMLT